MGKQHYVFDKASSMDEAGVSVDRVEHGLTYTRSFFDWIPSEQLSISLEWVNIGYCIKKTGLEKTILHPMSGRADPGEMLAIMGTSGAGKTTLLDILAGRLISKNLKGHIFTNDRPVNYSTFRKQSGYVMQSDALFPLLTVKETLHYAAHLGIQGKTYAEREAAANSTMIMLGLEHVQDTIIGDNLNRGLSGGEKRRVSIAVDIIHEPPVIFLDEPTSGLDSTTAVTVIEALKGIAVNRNSTLIVTIHQPSARLYGLFDKCLFLSGGRVTYSGPAAGLQEYAAKIYLRARMGPPPVANAPEVFLELCDNLIETDRLKLAIVDTSRKLIHEKSFTFQSVNDDFTTANNFTFETYMVFSRNAKNILRTKDLFIARLASSVAFGFLLGTSFYRRPETDDGVNSRVAYSVFTCAFFSYTNLGALPIFHAEKEIFRREYSRGAYRAISYVTAVSLVHIPFLSVLGFMFAVTSYWLVMLPNRAETFLFFVLTLLCTNIAAQSFAVLVSVLVSDPITGRTVGYTIFSVMLLLSGFFVTQDNIPYCWSWIHYSSLLKYSYESFVVNILLDKIETSTRTNGQIMMMLSMENISRWRGIGVLLGFALLYRLAFYAALIRYHNGRRTE